MNKNLIKYWDKNALPQYLDISEIVYYKVSPGSWGTPSELWVYLKGNRCPLLIPSFNREYIESCLDAFMGTK